MGAFLENILCHVRDRDETSADPITLEPGAQRRLEDVTPC